MILKVYKSSSILSVTLLTLGSHIGERLTAHYYQFSISYYIRCIRQTFFIIDIAKTLIHLKKALHFVKHLASRNYNILFYHSSIYKVSYLKSIFHFIVTLKTNNSYIGYKWMPGLINNYKNTFLYFLCTILNINFVNKRRARKWITYVNTYALVDKATFFRYLLFKVLYLTYEKTLLKIKKWHLNYKNILKFWKLFIFFKNFKSIFHMPDCLFIITPIHSWAHVHEYAKAQNVPVVGLLDCINHGLTYAIPSNDDSIALSLFYVSLFCNAYIIERYTTYNL